MKLKYTPQEIKYHKLIYKYQSLNSTVLLILLFPIFVLFVAGFSPDDEFEHFMKFCESFKTFKE